MYRKVTDFGFISNHRLEAKSRAPDISKESNYIFERQLQFERSVDFDFKEFLKNKYGKDLVQSVSLLPASDWDDNPDLMYAFTVKVDAGNNTWNGRVMAEQLDEW